MSVAQTDGTTEQQKLFAYAYFNNGGKATAAAIEAGYSPDSATQQASRLLTYANVLDLIRNLQSQLVERVLVTKEAIVLELQKVGFSDIRQLYNQDNTLIDINQLPDNIAASISSVEVDELYAAKVKVGETKKVKLHSKLQALSQLVDIYGYNAPLKTAQTNSKGEDVVYSPQIVVMPPQNSQDIKERE